MVTMGGGPDGPNSSSKEKDLVVCVLPWPEQMGQRGVDALKKEIDGIDVRYIHKTAPWQESQNSPDIPEDDLKCASYLATLSWLPPSPDSLPNVNFIQFFSAGTNHIAKHPIYTDSKIPLCSANGVHGPQIAEWVTMMELVFSHNYVPLWEQQKNKEWKQSTGMSVSDRVGKRVGILGYGSIGRQVARVCKAMGMDVIAFTASPRKTAESRKDTGYIVPGTGDPEGEFPSEWYSGLDKENLHNFLKQEIDLLVVGVPLTEATTHLLSTEEFEVLHKSNHRGTLVANIARGPCIDQKALVTALEKGQIRGAALDVTDPEPLPKDDPLWEAPNVLITPHCSGSTDVYIDRAFQVLAENIRRQRSGKKLVNEVNRKNGY